MIYEIPLKPVPSQQTTVGIGGRDITVAVRLRLGRLYADVKADGEYLIQNRVCLDGVPLVNEVWRGLPGDLYFIDKQGTDDPQWQELGGRFILVYHDGH